MLASILATINFNESYDVTDETSKNWTPFSILIDLINKFLFYDYFYFIWQEYHFFLLVVINSVLFFYKINSNNVKAVE